MATAQRRSAAARIAVNTSWARTANRTERTAAGYKASPMSLDYHIAAVRAEGVLVHEQDILKAATNKHRAHQQQMSLRAAKSREAKQKAPKPKKKAPKKPAA